VLAQPRKRTAGRNRLDISNDLFPEGLAGELRERARIIGRLRRALWPDLISSAM
jgi:hypothetical protein